MNYACHCVTLSNNQISGDWAGFAMEAIERQYPGVIALTSVGCGADPNPSSGVTGDKARSCRDAEGRDRRRGQTAVRTAAAPGDRPSHRHYAAHRPALRHAAARRPNGQQRAEPEGAIGHHAQVTLARLDRGEQLPDGGQLSRSKRWTFGDSLAMVFLPGEVVVDYSLRLKRNSTARGCGSTPMRTMRRATSRRERVLKEGGYEGGDAMIYYDHPRRFWPGLEQQIVDVVHAQLDKPFSRRSKPADARRGAARAAASRGIAASAPRT